VRILLDTHILLWALATPAKLPIHLRRELDQVDVFVSAASIWEVAIKSSIGKIDANPRHVHSAALDAGFKPLPVTGEHAARVGMLALVHKDPFDRLLVAQAQVEQLSLVTNDAALSDYGEVVRVLRRRRGR
jgi:PIN domain nuclease of toxin-antitoxin system